MGGRKRKEGGREGGGGKEEKGRRKRGRGGREVGGRKRKEGGREGGEGGRWGGGGGGGGRKRKEGGREGGEGWISLRTGAMSCDVCTLLLGLKIASPCSILARVLVASSNDAFMKDGCTITRWMYSRSSNNNSMSYMCNTVTTIPKPHCPIPKPHATPTCE